MNAQLDRPALAFESAYRDQHIIHHTRLANWKGALKRAYLREMKRCYRFLVPPQKRILEIGCGSGDLLAALKPSDGVGIDFAEAVLDSARRRHPSLTFLCSDAHRLPLEGTFDFIILSDLVNDLW